MVETKTVTFDHLHILIYIKPVFINFMTDIVKRRKPLT